MNIHGTEEIRRQMFLDQFHKEWAKRIEELRGSPSLAWWRKRLDETIEKLEQTYERDLHMLRLLRDKMDEDLEGLLAMGEEISHA